MQSKMRSVKRISFADRTILIDDETSDCLVEYAALLGAEQSADTVRICGIGQDGDDIEADLVLNAASNLVAESTHSSLEPPTNPEANEYMRARMKLLRDGPAMKSGQTGDIPLDIPGVDDI